MSKSSEKKLPPKWWYDVMDELHSKKHIPNVVHDIDSNPEVKKKVEPFREAFIKFAALERMHFKPDIEDELQEYLAKSRMYKINVKKWYRIINKVFKRDNYTCQYCGNIGGKLEADHIVPFSKGGSDDMENLTTACRTCNRQKKDKSVEEFLKWKECNEQRRLD